MVLSRAEPSTTAGTLETAGTITVPPATFAAQPDPVLSDLDRSRGIRQFVAGMGGISHYSFGAIEPNSEVRNADTYGVLKLTLHTNPYDWQFIPEAGKTFTDSGTTACH